MIVATVESIMTGMADILSFTTYGDGPVKVLVLHGWFCDRIAKDPKNCHQKLNLLNLIRINMHLSSYWLINSSHQAQ